MTPAAVKRARKRLGLTQRAFAERLGLSAHGRRTVRRWERGETPISARTEAQIKQLLVTIEGTTAPKTAEKRETSND